MARFQPFLGFVTGLIFLAFAQAALAQEAGPIEIVAFGDSLTAGYGVEPGEAFPEQLEAALRDEGYEVEIVNAGVSGDTTAGGLARLEWSVPQTADLVIVELGANDALRGVSPTLTRQNLGEILDRLTARDDTRVILAGMIAPPNMGGDYSRDFNPVFEDLAASYDVAFYPFFLDGVASITDLNQADDMHPNANGIAVIVERILPIVRQELDAILAERGS